MTATAINALKLECQTCPERSGVGAEFHSNQTEATRVSESQDQLIKQLESGVPPA